MSFPRRMLCNVTFSFILLHCCLISWDIVLDTILAILLVELLYRCIVISIHFSVMVSLEFNTC